MSGAEPWKVTLVDTGEKAMTGGRLLSVKNYLMNEENFASYGDGLSDTDISKSIKFHEKHGKAATLTSVSPPNRFGVLKINNGQVIKFEKTSN